MGIALVFGEREWGGMAGVLVDGGLWISGGWLVMLDGYSSLPIVRFRERSSAHHDIFGANAVIISGNYTRSALHPLSTNSSFCSNHT